MAIDVRTLFLAVSVASGLGVIVMCLVWPMNRNMPGIGWWVLGAASGAAALPLYILQDLSANRWLTHAFPTLLHLSMSVSFFAGASRTVGRNPPWILQAIALPVIFGLYLFFLWGYDDLAWRVRTLTIWCGAFAAGSSWILFGQKSKRLLVSSRFLGAAFSAGAILMVARLFVWSVGNHPTHWIGSHAWQNTSLALAALIMTHLLLFGVLLLANQYQTAEISRHMQLQHDAEQELHEARHELERQRHLRMRQTMARELHDGIGGITATMAVLAEKGKEGIAEEQTRILSIIGEMAIEGTREIRGITDAVETGVFRWSDLLRELENYTRRVMSTTDISPEWKVEGVPPGEIINDPACGDSVSKVITEAVHNLIRHSHANHCRLHFRFSGDSFEAEIRDDGRGYVSRRPGGRGIANMEERIVEMGGKFSIESDHGTILRFSLPLPLSSRL